MRSLGELIQRQVKDPRVGFVTITAVRVTPDLSKAHVYYTVLGDERSSATPRPVSRARSRSCAPRPGAASASRRCRSSSSISTTRPRRDSTWTQIIDEIHKTELAVRHAAAASSRPTSTAALARAVEVIEAAASIGLACHIRPDGDALGSLLALALALERARRPDPAELGRRGRRARRRSYDFLPGDRSARADERRSVRRTSRSPSTARRSTGSAGSASG